MVTGLEVVQSANPGWIGVECDNEAMALWLLRAIVVENISVRREGTTLYFPASPRFRLESEVKNVICDQDPIITGKSISKRDAMNTIS